MFGYRPQFVMLNQYSVALLLEYISVYPLNLGNQKICPDQTFAFYYVIKKKRNIIKKNYHYLNEMKSYKKLICTVSRFARLSFKIAILNRFVICGIYGIYL